MWPKAEHYTIRPGSTCRILAVLIYAEPPRRSAGPRHVARIEGFQPGHFRDESDRGPIFHGIPLEISLSDTLPVFLEKNFKTHLFAMVYPT